MNNLLKALARFQEEVKPIQKRDDNPYFKSKYASLDAIQHHIKSPLQKSGLVVTQANVVINDLPFVQTKVWHVESGESIDSVFPVIVSKQTAQDYGSAVSYAKRYSLTGLLNLIVQDEDDDGNSISVGGANGFLNTGGRNTSVTTAKPPSTPTSPLLDQEKYDAMVKFINDGKIKEVEAAMKNYTLNDSQKKLLTSLLNQAKAQAVTKNAKK